MGGFYFYSSICNNICKVLTETFGYEPPFFFFCCVANKKLQT